MADARPPYRAGELLQTATTIAAVTLALAALMDNRGPAIGGRYLIQITLLFTGLLAIAGSLYAMDDMRNEFPEQAPHYFYFIEWGLLVTSGAYLWLMIDFVP